MKIHIIFFKNWKHVTKRLNSEWSAGPGVIINACRINVKGLTRLSVTPVQWRSESNLPYVTCWCQLLGYTGHVLRPLLLIYIVTQEPLKLPAAHLIGIRWNKYLSHHFYLFIYFLVLNIFYFFNFLDSILGINQRQDWEGIARCNISPASILNYFLTW